VSGHDANAKHPAVSRRWILRELGVYASQQLNFRETFPPHDTPRVRSFHLSGGVVLGCAGTASLHNSTRRGEEEQQDPKTDRGEGDHERD
jgi:hypothetical protein